MSIRVSMIAAVAENGVIGASNSMPWHLPGDFAFFRRITMGKPHIMGRKTFESIGKPLPGRTNIVVSSNPGYRPEGVLVADSPEKALALALSVAAGQGADEVMIGGGGVLYQALMGRADRLYITHVALSPPGDTRFPPIDPAIWQVTETPEIAPSAKDTASFRIKVYDRAAH